MEPVLRIRTRVLPGHRIEIYSPQLPEGAEVEVAVSALPLQPRCSLAQLMRERPPSDTPQAVDSWEQYEQLLQQERDEWER
ncbi:MAG: hypothetical protein NZ874_03820 [Fimbriimonadales bacterium]|nr:hypothetical protein [Fimbriimonadales bacterium]